MTDHLASKYYNRKVFLDRQLPKSWAVTRMSSRKLLISIAVVVKCNYGNRRNCVDSRLYNSFGYGPGRCYTNRKNDKLLTLKNDVVGERKYAYDV